MDNVGPRLRMTDENVQTNSNNKQLQKMSCMPHASRCVHQGVRSRIDVMASRLADLAATVQMHNVDQNTKLRCCRNQQHIPSITNPPVVDPRLPGYHHWLMKNGTRVCTPQHGVIMQNQTHDNTNVSLDQKHFIYNNQRYMYDGGTSHRNIIHPRYRKHPNSTPQSINHTDLSGREFHPRRYPYIALQPINHTQLSRRTLLSHPTHGRGCIPHKCNNYLTYGCNGSSSPICYKCKQVGHVMRNCYVIHHKSNRKTVNKGSPIVTGIHFGNKSIKFNALLDTGSDVSLLNLSVFKTIPRKHIIHYSKNKNTDLKLNSASGHSIKSVGRTTIVMFIKGSSYKVDFILTEGFKFDILLGIDFVYTQKAKLDFLENTMLIRNRIICLKNKQDIKQCSILESTSLQYIRPYSITHVQLRPRNKVNSRGRGTHIITPLNNTLLFHEQSGIQAASIVVNVKGSTQYVLPIVNNTGVRYRLNNKIAVAFIEPVTNKSIISFNINYNNNTTDCNSSDLKHSNFKNHNENKTSTDSSKAFDGVDSSKAFDSVDSSKVFNTKRDANRLDNRQKFIHLNKFDYLNSENTCNCKIFTSPHSNQQCERRLNINNVNAPDTVIQVEQFNIGLDPNDEKYQVLHNLLVENEKLFVNDIRKLTQTNILQATFNTGTSQPIKQRPYKNPLALQAEIDRQIIEMLEADIIRPSSSPYSSPMIVIPKKDGTHRCVIDYRRLNQSLVKDSYPLPRIEDIFATLGTAKYFSTLDLKSGYHQISVHPNDREKTAFCTRTGLYEFQVLPFGISSAPAIFQRMIAKVLHGIEGKFSMAYLDDILIYSETFELHLEHIKEVFARIKNANLSLNKKKCHFVKSEIEYLGHIVTAEGIKPNPEKVRAIQTLEPPTTVKGIRSFIGMVGYYRSYVPQFSAISRPLTKLTHKNAKFVWDDDAQKAFDYLKTKLTEAPILGYPDVTKPYSLYTDASDYSIGAILTQDTAEGEKVIQYISHQLAPNRLHYPIVEKECYAIIYSLLKLRQYLLGADVTVYTDHAPLKSLFTAEMKNTRIQRWAILLDEYQVKIKYRQGKHNLRADMLSRIRIKPTKQELEEADNIMAIEDPPLREQVRIPMYDDVDFDGDFNMKAQQAADKHCKHIIIQLKNNDNEKVSNEYVLQDKLLYHIGKINRFETEPILQLVIPVQLKHIVLEGYHSAMGSGHVGLEKNYQKIRSKYFWLHCYKDVVDYVTKCEVCQRRMLRRQQAELQDNINPKYPMECVGIDTVGPFITSENGNHYIVTVVDWYSAWVEAYPVPNKEANTIAKVLMEHFIPQHGCPRVLISDRGSEYVNAAIDLLATKMKIKRNITTPYHPAGNAKTERCHRFINDIIAKGLQDRMHTEWEDMLPAALFAMRTCVNDSTKYTPYMLLYGRDPVLPLDTLLAPRRRYYGEDYVPTMLQRLHAAFVHVADNTKQAREDIKRQADKRAHQREFLAGDPVYLHDPVIRHGQMKKFSSPWRPYFRIVEMLTPVTALIRCQKTGKSKTVHVNNLRYANLHKEWDFDGSTEGSDDTAEVVNARRIPAQRIQPHRRVKGLFHARNGFAAAASDSDAIPLNGPVAFGDGPVETDTTETEDASSKEGDAPRRYPIPPDNGDGHDQMNETDSIPHATSGSDTDIMNSDEFHDRTPTPEPIAEMENDEHEAVSDMDEASVAEHSVDDDALVKKVSEPKPTPPPKQNRSRVAQTKRYYLRRRPYEKSEKSDEQLPVTELKSLESKHKTRDTGRDEASADDPGTSSIVPLGEASGFKRDRSGSESADPDRASDVEIGQRLKFARVDDSSDNDTDHVNLVSIIPEYETVNLNTNSTYDVVDLFQGIPVNIDSSDDEYFSASEYIC